MKQLLLLMLIVGSAVSLSAQTAFRNENGIQDQENRYDRNDDRYNGKYDNYDRNRKNESYNSISGRNKREMRRQIAQINRNYDQRIQYVKRNRFTSRRDKMRKINELEHHRHIAISRCRDKFSGQRSRDYADRNYRKGRR